MEPEGLLEGKKKLSASPFSVFFPINVRVLPLKNKKDDRPGTSFSIVPAAFALVREYVQILFPFGVGPKWSKWFSNVCYVFFT